MAAIVLAASFRLLGKSQERDFALLGVVPHHHSAKEAQCLGQE
jgi:hypothetical protein